jgi:two-component system, NtrC family, sensor kinase
MVRANEVIGAINMYRQDAGTFLDKQVELVQNFAAQAVIAIENAQLLNELRQRTGDLSEALEQQTATSDVLKVISSSPGELEPVFKTILQNATRICSASFANLYLHDEDYVNLVASHNMPPAFANARRGRRLYPPPESMHSRVIKTKETVGVADLAATKAHIDRNKFTVEAVELGGVRTGVMVPLLKEKQLLGIISIYRQEVLPFTDKQVELVQNFAAQAVIAIENARLLNELRQSLEQQTATSEMLRVVISRSATDIRPVFETIAHNSVHLCGATYGVVFRFDGEMISFVAHHNLDQAGIDTVNQMFPLRPNTSSVVGRHSRAQRGSYCGRCSGDE